MKVSSYEDALRLSRRSTGTSSAGFFSIVVPDPDDPNMVHKISKRDDPAYRDFVEMIALPNQGSPAVPRIADYQTWPYRSRSSRRRHYVKMERLEPVARAPVTIRQRAADLLAMSLGNVNEFQREYRDFKDDFRGGTIQSIARRVKREQPSLYAMFREVRKVIRETGHSDDMHDKNIMWRPGTDDLVITDPLYT